MSSATCNPLEHTQAVAVQHVYQHVCTCAHATKGIFSHQGHQGMTIVQHDGQAHHLRTQDAGLTPDEYTFANMMNACAKAEHPPYPLADKFADKALELLAQMKAFGLKPNDVHYNTVMTCQVRGVDRHVCGTHLSCQAKAKRVEAVEKLLQEMSDAGIQPSGRSFNILIDAAARQGDAVRALQIAENDLPAAGLQPDTVTYNTVLFACAEVA